MKLWLSISCLLACVLLFACRAPQAPSQAWRLRATRFAVSRPEHFQDCERLERELRGRGVRVCKGDGHLGVIDLDVDSEQFARARKLAPVIIARFSLTVAIQKDSARGNTVLEEFRAGQKIGETDYGVRDGK
jgi:hypothetical protein